MKWELFKIGMRRNEWAGMPEGMAIDWTDECGLTLFVYLNSPSVEELADMSAGRRFEVAFKDVDGIGFFMFKFGQQPWGDCAFSPNLYPVTPRFEEITGTKTYALHVMVVDVSVGELKVLRTIALGMEFAEHFRLWCLGSIGENVGERRYKGVPRACTAIILLLRRLRKLRTCDGFVPTVRTSLNAKSVK